MPTTFISFLIQAIPFFLILISKSDYLNSSLEKLVASLMVLFVAHTREIWLNTITSQFHFVIILFLLSLDLKDNISISKQRLYFLLTLTAGLSGIPANILAPLFLLNFYFTKQKIHIKILAILALTTIVQIAYIVNLDGGARINIANFDAVMFVGRVFFTVFSSSKILTVLGFLMFLLLLIAYKKRFFHIYLMFFGSALLLAAMMTFMSLGMGGGGRYAYAPSVIFLLGLFYLALESSIKNSIKVVILVYIGLVLFAGIKYPINEGSFDSTHWKKWKDEVALYRNGSQDTITIYPQWPNNVWSIKLPIL